MLKVLIADDEELIRRMIEKMIDWEGRDLALAGTAGNGREVLDLIEERHPDIIITDIRMPGVDGLELIERAHEKAEAGGYRIDFIIISGYKNFEYAHQALTLGVRHYLLKPIDRGELGDALDAILAERRKADLSRLKTEELQEARESYRRSARQHFLNSVLAETELGESGREAVEERLEFREDRYLAFFVKVDWTEEGDVPAGLLEILRTVIEREEAELWHCEFVSSEVMSGIISVINYPGGAREAHPDDMEMLYTKCRKETDKFAGCTVTFGVGAEKGRIEETARTIDEAVRAVKCRIHMGLDRVIFYERLQSVSDDIGEILTADMRSGNRRAAEALDAEAVKADIQLLYEKLRYRSGYSPLQLFTLIGEMAELIAGTFRDNAVDGAVTADFERAVEILMDRCTTEARMVQRFQDVTELYFRKVLTMRHESGQAPIREAKRYLMEHFRGNPTLEEVAEEIGMSPAYFSTVFKKELGIGFSEYLTQLRCEEAKKLMRSTQESLAAIAEKVGYQDAKYFSRIFRRTVGIKPSDYRKLYQ